MARCLVVAEAGVNHENDPDIAADYVRAAAACGADAVKFQTYRADRISTKTATPYWSTKGSQHDTFAKLDRLPWSCYRDLVALGKELGILVFSTPFDLEAVDMLDEAGVEWFKIASADITYHGLLRKVASKRKPVILSTGAATLSEVAEAYSVLGLAGAPDITLLHCTLSYPCPPESINLRAMQKLQQVFGNQRVGLSDHSIGTTVPIAAAALGACMIEKHFTLAKGTKGVSPDHWLSADPTELCAIVEGVQVARTAMGRASKRPDPAEAQAVLYARRSVTSMVDIPAGAVITPAMLTCKRPGTGISAALEQEVAGRVAAQDIRADTTMTWEMLR